MSFGSPYLLLGLIAVPLCLAGSMLLERRRRRRAAVWSRAALLPNIVRRPPAKLARVPLALFLLGLTFLLVGFARPQRALDSGPANAPTIVLAFDLSGSMAADDVRPTRLRAARQYAAELVRELPAKYQVAVVTFADNVQLAVAPTRDRQKVLAGLPTAITPRGATAIGDGIREGVSVIVRTNGKGGPGDPKRPGAVLLFSDGTQTAKGTTPAEAAETAYADGIPVDALAVGTRTGIVTQQVTVNGFTTSIEIPVPVDPAKLQAISRQTRGRLFRNPSAGDLKAVYDHLGSNGPDLQSTHPHALAAASTGLALLFVLAGIVMSGLLYGRVP